MDVRKKTQGEKNSKLNKKTQNSSSKLRKSAFFSIKKNCKKYSVGKLIDAPIDENTPNSRKKLKNSRKKLKTQAKNSKSRHFLKRRLPEMRSKRKPVLFTRSDSSDKTSGNVPSQLSLKASNFRTTEIVSRGRFGLQLWGSKEASDH